MTVPLRELIRNPTAAELELVARYAAFKPDARRERLFAAFASTGLPHRRLEAWKWTDFRQSLAALAPSAGAGTGDPLTVDGASIIRFSATGCAIPDALAPGLRIVSQTAVQAFSGAEDAPMGALAAALAGGKAGPETLTIEVSGDAPHALHLAFSGTGQAHFARVAVLLRPGARLDISESHLGGAALGAVLFEYTVQTGARLTRTVFQRASTAQAIAVTATVHLDAGAALDQTTLALGARLARLETRLVHAGPGAKAVLNAAYLAGAGHHADITTHVRHGAVDCTTRQLTKGAVMAGGRGVFQGKFHVPRNAGQRTDAQMRHDALLLEEGAEVFAKPELEIHADDVQCAHGNTCGALDPAQLFYLRQRGIPAPEARALLTEAFIAEALSISPHEAALRAIAADWLAR